MIIRAAKAHGVPEHLVRRIVMRESRYNPAARNHSFWGLMQISYPTAKSMGFRGSPDQLLNPLTNLTYAVPYLANAFIIAGKQEDAAVRLYASGYYASAKQRGLLGALRTAGSAPVTGAAPLEEPAPIVTASYRGAQAGDSTPQFEQKQAQGVVRTASARGGDETDSVEMTTNRRGKVEPPRRWQHDGGMTILSRGEQGVEKVAAFRAADQGGDPPAKSSRWHGRKNTTFAALDAPPANAQAYAAASAQLAQVPSQAAIAQATAGAAPAQAPVTTQGSPEEDKPRRHRRRSARHSHHEPEAPAETAAAVQQPAPPAQ